MKKRVFQIDSDLIIIDVETTGTVKNSSIIQLGAVHYSKYGKIVHEDYFNSYIAPYTNDWDLNAQQVHGLSKEFLKKNGFDIHEVLIGFSKWAYSITKGNSYLAQWSCGFDTSMLQRAYEFCGLRYPFSYRSWDIASIVRFYLASHGYNSSKSLSDSARLLGINKMDFKAHDALDDARLTGAVLQKVVEDILNK